MKEVKKIEFNLVQIRKFIGQHHLMKVITKLLLRQGKYCKLIILIATKIYFQNHSSYTFYHFQLTLLGINQQIKMKASIAIILLLVLYNIDSSMSHTYHPYYNCHDDDIHHASENNPDLTGDCCICRFLKHTPPEEGQKRRPPWHKTINLTPLYQQYSFYALQKVKTQTLENISVAMQDLTVTIH